MLSLNKCINQWCNFVNGWWQMGLALVRRGWGSSVAPVAPAQAKWVEVFGAETPLVFTSWWPLCAALSVLYSFITFLHTPFLNTYLLPDDICVLPCLIFPPLYFWYVYFIENSVFYGDCCWDSLVKLAIVFTCTGTPPDTQTGSGFDTDVSAPRCTNYDIYVLFPNVLQVYSLRICDWSQWLEFAAPGDFSTFGSIHYSGCLDVAARHYRFYCFYIIFSLWHSYVCFLFIHSLTIAVCFTIILVCISAY